MAWLKSFFGGSTSSRAGAVTTVLDLVTKSADLVSNPDDIDQMLDEVRRITAGLTPEQALAPKDEQVLLKVYLQIEQYLTTKEPIRTFTVQELRARCDEALKQKLTALSPAVSLTNKQALSA